MKKMATLIHDYNHDWPAIAIGLRFGSSRDLLCIVQGERDAGVHGDMGGINGSS